MAITIERRDYDFLLASAKFCSGIDRYVSLLNLDLGEVNAYKEENQVLAHVFNNAGQYNSFAESFTRFKINNMRLTLAHLIQICKNNKNYNSSIGQDLGFEVPAYAFLSN